MTSPVCRVEINPLTGSLEAVAGGRRRTLAPREVLLARFRHEIPEDIGAEVMEWPADLQVSKRAALLQVRFTIEAEKVSWSLFLKTPAGALERVPHIPKHRQWVAGSNWWPLEDAHIDVLCECFQRTPGDSLPEVTTDALVRFARHRFASSLAAESTPTVAECLQILTKRGASSNRYRLEPGVQLRPYQDAGARWLHALVSHGSGCILADEMGLGKSLQVIAMLGSVSERSAPSALLVVPSSLIANWKRELLRFAPSLSWRIHRGSQRTTNPRDLAGFDVVITTYDTVVSDLSLLMQHSWQVIVLDEAHYLRNDDTARYKAMKVLRRENAAAPLIAVTGTPVQNSISDSWALFELVLPGFLGTRKDFLRHFDDTVQSAESLQPLIRPFLLRRTVDEVLTDMPEKIDVPQSMHMTSTEALGYDLLRQSLAASGNPLSAIMKLRLYCAHPRLVDREWSNVELTESTKFTRLLEILLQCRATGEKALVFCAFNELSRQMAEFFRREFGLWTKTINGGTAPDDRQQLIDEFSSLEESACLVVNPQAGGVGLNIQAASTVIHYTLEWNPAVEDQATARAYRGGQLRPVKVYRLYYEDSVESVMNSRLNRKRDMAAAAIVGTDGTDTADLAAALAASPIIRHQDWHSPPSIAVARRA